MVAEKQNARWIIHLGILAHITLKENCCHRSDVFVTEAQISAGKARVGRFDKLDSGLTLFVKHVPGKYLLRHCHGALSGLDRRQKNFLLQACHIEWEEPAILDHLSRNFILATGEFSKRDFCPCSNLVDQ